MSCLLLLSSPLAILDSKKGNLRYRQNLWNEWSLSESNAGNGSGGNAVAKFGKETIHLLQSYQDKVKNERVCDCRSDTSNFRM